MASRRQPLTRLETAEAKSELVRARVALRDALGILENRKGIPAREIDRLCDMINTLNVVIANVEHQYGPKVVTR